jgi:hypothetical protein
MGALAMIAPLIPDILQMVRAIFTKGQSAQQKAIGILTALEDGIAVATKHPEYAVQLGPLIVKLTDDLSIVAEQSDEQRAALRTKAEGIFSTYENAPAPA